MTPDRWQQVQELFDQAMDRPPDQRHAFLATACPSDASLQAEVASLIAADEQAGDFISTPALGKRFVLPEPDALLDEKTVRPANQRVGAYRLVRLLASGGMGAVYQAERDDGQFHRQVAIKFIRHGFDTETIVRGFHKERVLLGQLQHPNIAGLLDAGATEDGLPYLVMEFVEGQPIDQFCDERKLSVHDRLELFRTVCSAVQYAHQKLIVHCDLKPSNILVTTDGVPKLLDFGIARILNPELRGHALHPTTVPLAMMTPDYASPEQVRGQPVSTASDVYSLGVVLYELLTGHRPFRLWTRLRHEIERTICEREPLPPSTAVDRVVEIPGPNGAIHTRITPASVSASRQSTPHRLQARISGDLDNIVLMALRKEPQRRYSSVEHLSEDVERHLDGLPVHARKDTFGYRSSKFIRRNRAGVLAACVAGAALIVALVSITWQARSLAIQRDEAQRQRGLAEGNLARAQEAETRYAREADIAKHNAEMANTAAAQAEAINAFQRTMLSSIKPANEGAEVTVLQALNTAALRVRYELADQPAVEAAVRRTIGQSYHSLGLFERAERQLRASVALYRRSLDETAGELTSAAQSFKALGDLLRDRGEYAEAETEYREALTAFQDVLGPEHHDTAEALTDLARLLYEKGDRAAAEPLCRRALAGYYASLERDAPGKSSLRAADSLNNLGALLQYTGDWTAAEPLYRRALAMRRSLLREDHPDIAESLNSLASVSFSKGDTAEAQSLLRQALVIRRKILPPEHPGIADTLMLLAEVLVERDRPAQAEPLIRECLRIRTVALGAGHWLTAEAQSVLGGCLAAQGRYDQAGPLLLESFPTIRTDCGEGHDRTVAAIERIVELYESQGLPDRAADFRALLSPTDGAAQGPSRSPSP